MLLSQILSEDGELQVVARDGTEAYVICNCPSTYALAYDCANRNLTLKERIVELGLGAAVDVEGALAQGRVIVPIHHPDPGQMFLSGGSLNGPDDTARAGTNRADWHYKGDGHAIGGPGTALLVNDLAPDSGGPAMAAIYIISNSGQPFRVGFSMANDFSARVLTTQSHAGVAQGKVRPLALGPEMVLTTLPHRITGTMRLIKDHDAVSDLSISSDQCDLELAITRLEHDNLASDILCQAGQLHILILALTPSMTIRAAIGAMATFSLSGFGLPLCNALHNAACRADAAVQINVL